ncbi:glycosyltransferase family 2 protein [Telmatospirillum siberiense]|nr:glycosyltransferase family 2 protein [Telmatospirillum siberiense]
MLTDVGLKMREEEDFWVSPARHSSDKISTTVVIPTFNAGPTLPRAARSVLGQTLRDIELVIVDDASTDSSWQTILGLLAEDPRVRVLRHKKNRGKSVAMNRAAAVAQGRWLAVLDADDWYHEDRLSTLTRLAERRRADMVADNQFLYDAGADQVVASAWSKDDDVWELSFDDFLIGSDAYDNFNLGMLKPVTRTDFIRKMKPAYEENVRCGEDFLHILKFYLMSGKSIIYNIPYYYYTQPFGSLSRQWSSPTRIGYDFQSVLNANQRCFQQTSHVLTRRQRMLLSARNRRLKSLDRYFRAKDAFSQRDWLATAALLTLHPMALTCLLHRLHDRLLSRPASRTIEQIATRACRLPLIVVSSQPGESDA